MSASVIQELQVIHTDLVVLEGMLETVKKSAYKDVNPVLLGNSLEVMGEFLAHRLERMDRIIIRETCG